MKNDGIDIIEPRTLYALNRKLNILVIKLDQLGDFVLAIPALLRLREKFKEADIDIIVGDWNVPLAKELCLFNAIYTYNFFGRNTSDTVDEIEHQESFLLKNMIRYDIAIDLRRHRDTRFLMSKIPASLKVGYKSFTEHDQNLDICLNAELDEIDLIKRPDRGSMVVQLLTLIESIPGTSLVLPRLADPGVSGKGIAIFPKAGARVKEWPLENYTHLVKKIIDQNPAETINIYLSPSEGDVANELSGLQNTQFFIGLRIKELVVSLAGNALTITNDSFGSHLSSYLGIPTVVIFSGRDNVQEWHPPFGNTTVIYSRVNCSPCHLNDVLKCPHDLICLRQISVGRVFEIIKRKLGSRVEERRMMFLPL